MNALGNYEVFLQKGGFYCIRQISSGETMHSVIEPAVEAKNLYVAQSGLADQASAYHESPYVIWDVGLGAATNALYTIMAYEEMQRSGVARRPLLLISFENDLDSLRLARLHPDKFPHVIHPALEPLLKDFQWSSENGDIHWQLLNGDFAKNLTQAAKPHCIYFDPFSRKSDDTLWSTGIFSKIHACCSSEGARLINYSVSTTVRRAMLEAGFILGIGAPSGPKAETTIAYSSQKAAEGKPLFPMERVEKWRRLY